MSCVYKHYIGPSAISYFMSKIKLFCPCVIALLHECTRAFEQIVCYGAVRSAILATARMADHHLSRMIYWMHLFQPNESESLIAIVTGNVTQYFGFVSGLAGWIVRWERTARWVDWIMTVTTWFSALTQRNSRDLRMLCRSERNFNIGSTRYSLLHNSLDFVSVCFCAVLAPALVLWRCWLGDRKGIQPVKVLPQQFLGVYFWVPA